MIKNNQMCMTNKLKSFEKNEFVHKYKTELLTDKIITNTQIKSVQNMLF